MSSPLAKAMVAAAVGAMLVTACTGSGDHGSKSSSTTSKPAKHDSGSTYEALVAPVEATNHDHPAELVGASCADPTTDTTNINCYTLTLPEDSEQPNGRQVELPVIRVHSNSDNPTAVPAAAPGAAPVVYLHGGPGDGAVDGWLAWKQLMFEVPGELIVFDQRGGGHSNPRLDCPEHSAALAASFAEHPGWNDAYNSIAESIEACNKRLRAQGIGLGHYNLTSLVADLEDLRRALGVEKLTLLAASYGTKIALAYQRLYPQHVSALALGGVTTLANSGPQRERGMLESAIERLFDACAADAGCAASHPNLPAKLSSAAKKLDSAPMSLGTNPVVKVTGDELHAGLFAALYDSTTIPLVPLAVDRIASGDQKVWSTIASQVATQLSGDTAFGAQMSISCADVHASQTTDSADSDRTLARRDPGRSRDLVLTGTDSFCDHWATTSSPSNRAGGGTTDTNNTGTSDTGTDAGTAGNRTAAATTKAERPPALVISGELDPITPASDARKVAKAIGGTYVEVPRAGHDAMLTVACARTTLRTFLTKIATGQAFSPADANVCSGTTAPPFS